MSAATALPGERFGKWTVVSIVGASKRFCRCDCGTERIVFSGSLRSGVSRTCGCVRGKRKRDPKRQGPEYKTWRGLFIRCDYSSCNGFHNYGGRGIAICERWRNSFEAFLEDMGTKPTPNHTIDRIDVNGNYEPDNCRWATWNEQRKNRRLKEPSPCRICQRLKKPLRKGRCHSCNEFFRRNGRDRERQGVVGANA